MPIIDFHNHYYPPKYMQALQSGASSIKVTVDSEGNPVLHYPGDYNVAVRGHRDLAYRQEVLDSHGVSLQVLTLTTPGMHVESPATAVKLASLVNDEFKEAMDTRGHHFTALARLPLNDPAAAVKELDRAIAASTRSRTAARPSRLRRAQICAISITTRSISIWPRCSSPSRSRDRNIFWRAAIIRIRSSASRRCSMRSAGCR